MVMRDAYSQDGWNCNKYIDYQYVGPTGCCTNIDILNIASDYPANHSGSSLNPPD